MVRCERCGSVGSIEFGMCQVCLAEYPEDLSTGLNDHDDLYAGRAGFREREGVLVGTT